MVTGPRSGATMVALENRRCHATQLKLANTGPPAPKPRRASRNCGQLRTCRPQNGSFGSSVTGNSAMRIDWKKWFGSVLTDGRYGLL